MNRFDRLVRFNRSRHQDQGFTIPTVMGIGIVMVLIAAALINRVQNDQAIAGMQFRSEGAINAAEIGIIRLQSFLTQNRLFATQNSAQWETLVTNLNNEIGSCPSLSLNSAWREGQSYAQGQWLNAGQADHQYRMLSYNYRSQPGSNGQVGLATLTIEGQVTGGLRPAVSRLAVEIPIATTSSALAPPALSAKSFNLDSVAKVNGDVRAHACPDLADVDRVPGIADTNLTAGKITAGIDTFWPQPQLAPASAISLPAIKSSITLPRRADFPDAQGNFDYVVDADASNNSIQLPDDQKIAVQVAANQSVNLYVRGNIDFGGGQVNMPVGETQPHPEKLRIYGSDRTLRFSIKDSASVMALIHAPLAIGSSEAAPKIGTGITGSLLLQQWDSATHHSQLPIKQLGGQPEQQRGIQLQPISNWQRQGQ
jgi:Tfp pilus assembly protein PilX